MIGTVYVCILQYPMCYFRIISEHFFQNNRTSWTSKVQKCKLLLWKVSGITFLISTDSSGPSSGWILLGQCNPGENFLIIHANSLSLCAYAHMYKYIFQHAYQCITTEYLLNIKTHIYSPVHLSYDFKITILFLYM